MRHVDPWWTGCDRKVLCMAVQRSETRRFTPPRAYHCADSEAPARRALRQQCIEALVADRGMLLARTQQDLHGQPFHAREVVADARARTRHRRAHRRARDSSRGTSRCGTGRACARPASAARCCARPHSRSSACTARFNARPRVNCGPQPAEQREVGQALAEEQRRQQRPVVGVVPDHLDRHHLRIAEQRVLVLVKRQRVFVEREVQLLVNLPRTARTAAPARSLPIRSQM